MAVLWSIASDVVDDEGVTHRVGTTHRDRSWRCLTCDSTTCPTVQEGRLRFWGEITGG